MYRYINYEIFMNSYYEAIEYCFKNSDFFSWISTMKKPYSAEPVKTKHDDIIEEFSPYLYSVDRNITEWPGTKTGGGNHCVLLKYSNNCKSLLSLLKKHNFLSAAYDNLPHDITFYKKTLPWIVTIKHEKISYIENPTKDDLDFLAKNSLLI